MNFDKYYPFKAVPLPYDIKALCPDISEYTLYFHHDKHYCGYVDKLNSLIEHSLLMQNIPLEGLAMTEDKDIRAAAGGIYNHELYFASLTPQYREPSAAMLGKMNASFGSAEKMIKEISDAAMKIIGSGWVWLAEDRKGRLEILVTKDQDTIDLDKYTPLLNIDVWEHAYYLDRQNRRAEYIKSVMNVINWVGAENRSNDT